LESIAQPFTKIKKRNPRSLPLGSWSAPGGFQRLGVLIVCAPLKSIAQPFTKIKEKSA
jgi:hypothetical protein